MHITLVEVKQDSHDRNSGSTKTGIYCRTLHTGNCRAGFDVGFVLVRGGKIKCYKTAVMIRLKG